MGHCIFELDSVQYGDVKDIESDFLDRYRSCRGRMSIKILKSRIEMVCAAKTSEIDNNDELKNEIWDGLLFDELMHQYTMYSITPIALHYIIKITTKQKWSNNYVFDFVQQCIKYGTGQIYLNDIEIIGNGNGMHPIFRIENVAENWIPVDRI